MRKLPRLAFSKQIIMNPIIKQPNTMNSTLIDAAFFRRSLTSKSQQLRPPQLQRHLLIVSKRRGAGAAGRKHVLELKPVQAAATQRPNSTGDGLNKNNPNRSDEDTLLRGVVQEFYSSLNAKDSERLEKLVASDCVIEDNVYYKPLDIKVFPAKLFVFDLFVPATRLLD
ncbi:hypothetical protein GUJ93_ZPchr0008g12581 [Zizania palustris]|uniref:Uncharacterized protein n=1 Tax=Zizania palustris TaxID=103762 RepID=A0A8J5QYY1_ZIZPA|nr:hypothetical protein GUJ93_ZPchr0008g12581 [Zizania palustris]